MDKKQIEAMLLKRSEKEEKTANQERSKFLADIITRAKDEFQHYNQGYRTFSVGFPKNKHFAIDDEIITTIIDGITNAYECKNTGFALTEIVYPKSYTFTFHKEKTK
jgi:hypothetical protein